MPELVISLDGEVARINLTKERTTLGRRSHNDIVIDRLAVSGEHALLYMNGGYVLIEDLNSTNGTYVNGQLIRIKALEENDLIEISDCRLLFHDRSSAPAAAPDTAQPPRLDFVPTEPGHPVAANVARLRVLPGSEGQDVALQKVVTTVGRPGSAVATVTHRKTAYMVAALIGSVTLNGVPLTTDTVELKDRDVLELDGAIRLEFNAASD